MVFCPLRATQPMHPGSVIPISFESARVNAERDSTAKTTRFANRLFSRAMKDLLTSFSFVHSQKVSSIDETLHEIQHRFKYRAELRIAIVCKTLLGFGISLI